MASRLHHIAQLERMARPTVPMNEPATDTRSGASGRFHFWRGASGRRYAHTVYSLLECPMLHRGTYVLVRREASGARVALRIAATEHEAPSLNLADIRRRGALLGADEVHVHLLADTPEARRDVERDLKGGLGRALMPEPISELRH